MSTIPTRDDDTIPPSDDLRAGEYVLGVLDADARRQVQARIAAEPAFARLVDAWEARLAPWLATASPVEPSPQAWLRLRTRLGWAPVEGARTGLWHRTSFWRATTALATAASVAAIAFALRGPVPSGPPDTIAQATPPSEEALARPVTVLAGDDGTTGWIATVEFRQRKVLMVPVPRPAEPDGRINELWVIPPGGAPISLGFVSNERAHTVEVPASAQAALAVGATLAVTLEPAEGLPHAAPSGPVVAKGAITRI
jgi:anti-sigma-K factor RskA